MKNKKMIFFGCLALWLLGPWCVYAANIHIDTSSPFIYPEYSKKISMDFQDAKLVDVLKIFSQQTDLNLISSEDIAQKRVTVYLDNVSIEEALEQVLRANNLTYEIQTENNIYIVKPLARPEVALITRVYQLKHAAVSSSKIKQTLKIDTGTGAQLQNDENTTTTGITAAISGILTASGKVIEDPRTNSLIITDIASNFPNIESAIARLDVQLVQILIELEMLEVSKGTADLIGIKIGNTPLTFTGGTRDHFYPWNQNNLIRNKSGKEFLTDFQDAEYTVGTIDASGLSATLQFLRTQSDTKTLARPRILTLNHEPAQIKIVTDEAIGSATTTSSSQTTATQSIEAERVETGVALTVTPQANLLTGEIIMAVVPKVSIARTGGTFSGVTFKDPEERQSQSILRVQSGETVVIGGLLRTDISNTITKVPVLGDIPFLGRAFRHNDESITEKELIIFITPHILDENYAFEPAIPADSPIPSAAVSLRQKEGLGENTRGPSRARVSSGARAIIREQDIPLKRLKEVERELSIIENKAL